MFSLPKNVPGSRRKHNCLEPSVSPSAGPAAPGLPALFAPEGRNEFIR
jgi:hypothetical protein